jgi:Mrp family chromosome partitioning ATPase
MSRVADALHRARLGLPRAGGESAEIDRYEHPWGAGGAAPRERPRPADAPAPTLPVLGARQLPVPGEIDPQVRQQLAGLVERVFLRDSPETLHCVAFADATGQAQAGRITAAVARLLAAQTPAQVCALDTAFQHPSLHEWFGAPCEPGLSEFLQGTASLTEVAAQAGRNLWVVPAGAYRPDLALSSPPVRHRLAELLGSFEFILASAPPIDAAGEAGQLWFADAAILLIAAGRTRREHARQIAEHLRVANVPVLGTVLSNRAFPIPASLYNRL